MTDSYDVPAAVSRILGALDPKPATLAAFLDDTETFWVCDNIDGQDLQIVVRAALTDDEDDDPWPFVNLDGTEG